MRVLHRGTVSAIRRALAEDPEGFHVLHLSCHAGPGTLVLEDDDGNEDRVTAERLVEEAVPAGTDLPLVVLAGCATGLRGPAEAGTEAKLMSFAEALARSGVPQVLAMQAPVSDPYATELAGELYGWLATARDTDVLVALAEARRACERRRQDLPADAPRRGEPEWATPALLVRGPRLPLYHREEASGPLHAIEQPALAEGIVVRGVGEFVGRRREEREGRLALAGTKAGLVIHGIGGVGKSTLSAELVRSAGSGMVVASKAGALGIDTLLEEVGLRLAAAGRGVEGGEGLVEAAQELRRADVEWAERWDLLMRILGAVPMLVLLDNFEDNLTVDAGTWSVTDPELADLLGRWARNPGKSKLLVTSRHPFELPGNADRRLAKLHLGPLSPAETSKLMWQLPGLDDLTRDQRERAYRDVGGHPRTLEYLDALLRRGEARFEDIAARMEDRLADKGIADPQAWLGSATRDFDANLAEAVTMAVDDVVLGDLLDELSRTPLARELVVGASVYRHPVDETALAWQVATEIEPVPDPAREARMQRVADAADAAAKAGNHSPSLEDLGLSAAEQAEYRADVDAATRPPLDVPDGLPGAMAAAAAAGLLSPATRGAEAPLWFVHRWTARAIAELEPDAVRASHAKAARFWAWRVEHIPQSREDDVEQQIEARFHHHAAGDADAAVALTGPIVDQLETWGHYGRAAELCRQTLGWVDERSAIAGEMHGRIAWLAYLRGDLDLAERGYRQAIEMLESAGDERRGRSDTTPVSPASSTHVASTPPPRPCTTAPSPSSSASAMSATSRRTTATSATWPSGAATSTPQRTATSRPLRSRNASATKRGWRRATTTSVLCPPTATTSTPPRCATADPSRSRSASATKAASPRASTTWVTWQSGAGTTTSPRRTSAGRWRSARPSATRPGWPRPTATSAALPRHAATTKPPRRSSADPSRSARASATWPGWRSASAPRQSACPPRRRRGCGRTARPGVRATASTRRAAPCADVASLSKLRTDVGPERFAEMLDVARRGRPGAAPGDARRASTAGRPATSVAAGLIEAGSTRSAAARRAPPRRTRR